MTDFAAAGLLDGLEGPAREAREALLTRLHADGRSLEELRQAAAAGRLSLLPVEGLLARRRLHCLEEAAQAAGLSRTFAEDNQRALGIPLPEPDEPIYDDDQVENLKVLKGLLDLGVPEEEIHVMGRILGQSSHRTAQVVVDVLSRALLRPGDTETDLALRLADLAEAMLPVLDRLTGAVLRLHLLDVVQREAVVRLEGDTGRLEGARPVAVAFADLAGFTALSDTLDIEELGRIAGHFEDLVLHHAAPPVRLVKVLGDGAMLVCEEPEPLTRALLDLVDAATEADLPPVHAAVAYGPALHTGGDWLGRTVNLASRLCAVAPPWTVLTTEAAPGYPEAGEHELRGIARPVPAYRAVR